MCSFNKEPKWDHQFLYRPQWRSATNRSFTMKMIFIQSLNTKN